MTIKQLRTIQVILIASAVLMVVESSTVVYVVSLFK